MRPTYFIAEAGVNHNGSIDLALQLVEEASKSGADAVKFQTFKAKNLVKKGTLKLEYQSNNTDENETQYDMIEKLELSYEEHNILAKKCNELGIEFLSTAFDLESLRFLIDLGIQRIKIPSGEITNGPLILRAAQSQLPIIVSTGMSSLEDIESALDLIAWGRNNPNPQLPKQLKGKFENTEDKRALKIIVLHCTSEYPAPLGEVNLNVISNLKEKFQIDIGYSDHTEGILISQTAVALGAKLVEKHFTLSNELEGPDHKASIEPDELKLLIDNIRNIELALGSSVKKVQPSESKNQDSIRKGLYFKRDLENGEVIQLDDLEILRPFNGSSPMEIFELLNQKTTRAHSAGESVKKGQI